MKKNEKAWDTYQATGITRYDTQVYEYDRICEAIRALIEKKEERDADLGKRRANCNWAINRLYDASYTREEVIRMLNNAVYW